jgi:hypothetical protein
MKTSELIKELMDHLLTHGDREVITAQKDENLDYTYAVTTGVVDYGDGTIGIVGEREKRCGDCAYYAHCRTLSAESKACSKFEKEILS